MDCYNSICYIYKNVLKISTPVNEAREKGEIANACTFLVSYHLNLKRESR